MQLVESNPDVLLRRAIERKQLIRLVYHGRERTVEPHDYGILNGSVMLLAYQIAGSSRRPLPNWIWMKVDEIDGLELLSQKFPGGRSTPSGKHHTWEKLFIRVKAADEHAEATAAKL